MQDGVMQDVMTQDVLTVTQADGRCHALLNRPGAGNALNASLVGALLELIERCTADGTHTLVIEGAGRHFCTGFDLSDVASVSDVKRVPDGTSVSDGANVSDRASVSDDTLLGRFVRIERLLQAVADAPFTTVAQVHGRAAGAGADLVAACQQRCITPDTTLSFPGATGFGLVLGTRRLAERVGKEIALEWVGTGRLVAADEALATGLATTLWRRGSTGQATTTRDDGRRPIDTRKSTASTVSRPDAFTAALLAQAMEGTSAPRSPPASHSGQDAPAHRERMNDRDLALLVASAARPGLALRIASYIDRLSRDRRAAASSP